MNFVGSAFLRAKFRFYAHQITKKIVRNSQCKSSFIPIYTKFIPNYNISQRLFRAMNWMYTICSGKISVEKMFDLTRTNDRAISHAMVQLCVDILERKFASNSGKVVSSSRQTSNSYIVTRTHVWEIRAVNTESLCTESINHSSVFDEVT